MCVWEDFINLSWFPLTSFTWDSLSVAFSASTTPSYLDLCSGKGQAVCLVEWRQNSGSVVDLTGCQCENEEGVRRPWEAGNCLWVYSSSSFFLFLLLCQGINWGLPTCKVRFWVWVTSPELTFASAFLQSHRPKLIIAVGHAAFGHWWEKDECLGLVFNSGQSFNFSEFIYLASSRDTQAYPYSSVAAYLDIFSDFFFKMTCTFIICLLKHHLILTSNLSKISI